MLIFGSGEAIAVPTNDATGAAVANPTPVSVAHLQDVQVDLSFESKTVYGNRSYPIGVGRGKAKIEVKAKQADVSAAALGSLFFGRAPVAGIRAVSPRLPAAIPGASTYVVEADPPNAGDFVADLGVIDAVTGKPFKRVGTAPGAGQYTVDVDGTYTFAAADAGKAIFYQCEYTATSAGASTFNITNELMGYTPSFSLFLSTAYDGKQFILKLNRCVSSKFSLPFKSDDFAINDFDAEAFADAAGNVGYLCMVE